MFMRTWKEEEAEGEIDLSHTSVVCPYSDSQSEFTLPSTWDITGACVISFSRYIDSNDLECLTQ